MKKSITVSIQGEKASNHDLAAGNFFGTCKRLYRDGFKQPFEDVLGEKADYALVAIENSLVGGINEVYDNLRKYDLYIVGELYMHISHCLIGGSGMKKAEITRIYSHPMALLQCEQYLSNYFSDVEIVESHDTAGSVAIIAKSNGEGEAAIASEQAAKLYGLEVLEREIEDNPENYTRFIVLTHKKNVTFEHKKSATKTSILLSTGDKPGVLYSALGSFAKRNINLSKLQSRPQPEKTWSYCFYIDIESGIEQPELKEALAEIAENGYEFSVLGSYPAGKTV